jgi:hypothetical protein
MNKLQVSIEPETALRHILEISETVLCGVI